MGSDDQNRSKLRSRIANLPHLSGWRLLRPRRHAHLYSTSRKGMAVENQQLGDNCNPLERKPLQGPDVTRRPSWLSFSSTQKSRHASDTSRRFSTFIQRSNQLEDTAVPTSNSPEIDGKLAPPSPSRRKSLGDAFQFVRAKWDLEKPTNSGQEVDVGRPWLSHDETPQLECSMESTPLKRISKPDPPQLEVLSGFQQGDLERSSTFRANLEKAVDDINVKYGSAQPLPFKHRSVRSLSPRHRTPTGNDHVRRSSPSRFHSNLKIPLVVEGLDNPATRSDAVNSETTHFSDISSCRSCGSPACCRRPSKTGIPMHQIDRILEESIHLRDPQHVSARMGSPELSKAEDEVRRHVSSLKAASLAPVRLSKYGYKKLVEGGWFDLEAVQATPQSPKVHENHNSLRHEPRHDNPVTPFLDLSPAIVLTSSDLHRNPMRDVSLIQLKELIKDS